MLVDVAIKSGKEAVLKSIISNLPVAFLTQQGTLINKGSLSVDQLQFSDCEETPFLIKTFLEEGKKVVRKRIKATQKDIEERIGIVLNNGDAATIVVLNYFLNEFNEIISSYYGEIEPAIEVQKISDQELNENGEFVLSWEGPTGRVASHIEWDGSLNVASPQTTKIRMERFEKRGLNAYIKSTTTPFVVTRRSIDYPEGSTIYIFVK